MITVNTETGSRNGNDRLPYLQERYGSLHCADTDPAKAAFGKYRVLKVRYVDILTTDMAIGRGRTDLPVEDMLEHAICEQAKRILFCRLVL